MPLPATTVLLCFLLTGVGSIAAETPRSKTSHHLSHAIQEGFRKDDGRTPEPTVAEPEVEVADEIVLPAMTVTGGPRIDSAAFTVEEPPKPVLGTGVSEFKGRIFTVKLRRILFIPIGFKLEW